MQRRAEASVAWGTLCEQLPCLYLTDSGADHVVDSAHRRRFTPSSTLSSGQRHPELAPSRGRALNCCPGCRRSPNRNWMRRWNRTRSLCLIASRPCSGPRPSGRAEIGRPDDDWGHAVGPINPIAPEDRRRRLIARAASHERLAAQLLHLVTLLADDSRDGTAPQSSALTPETAPVISHLRPGAVTRRCTRESDGTADVGGGCHAAEERAGG